MYVSTFDMHYYAMLALKWIAMVCFIISTVDDIRYRWKR